VNILCCLKQVPEKDARLVVDGAGISERDMNWEINEPDRYAIEESLRLKEAHGGEVVVVTIGPDRAQKALRQALAMGADRAVHLKDDAFQNGDPLATARALAAVAGQGSYDLILVGTRSDDAGYGATGGLLAGLLGWPSASIIMKVEVQDGSLRVARELENNRQEIAELPLPAVLTIQSGLNEVRYASLKGIMAAKKKPLDAPSPADLGLEASLVGAAGSSLETLDLSEPEKGGQCQFIEGDPATAAKELVERLRKEAKVL
jgi:electron transfer flavoprotein beta subunit